MEIPGKRVQKNRAMCRTVIRSAVLLAIALVPQQSEGASILFSAPVVNCSAVTHECFDGITGVASGGFGFSAFSVPANSLITEITVWGISAKPLAIYSAVPFSDQLPQLLIPNQLVATLDLSASAPATTLYGFHTSPPFDLFQYVFTLDTGILIPDARTYFLESRGSLLRSFDLPTYFVGGVPNDWHSVVSAGIGMAFELDGTPAPAPVPEPATAALVTSGAFLLTRWRLRKGVSGPLLRL